MFCNLQGIREFTFLRHPAELPLESFARNRYASDPVHHMNRYSDRPRLVRNRSRNGLPDPPSRIGRQLEATLVVELLHCLHETDVAFLNQIQERYATIAVLSSNRDDQSK